MNLSEAKLCLDCDEIYTGEKCRCGSTYYWWLSKYVKVMHRTPCTPLNVIKEEEGKRAV